MRGRIEKRVGKTGVSYRIRWEMGSDVQGRRTQPSKTFKTRKEAESALAEALKEAHQGTAIVEDKRTLGVYLADWLETLEKRVRPSTARRYRELLSDHVIPQLGRVQLVKLTPLHLERLYTNLLKEGRKLGRHKSPHPKKGLSEGTVELVHIILHKALKQAVRWGLVVRNVTEMVESPRRRKREFATWDSDQVASFLIAAKQDDYAALWPLAIFTGMRRGELLGIKWEDLDLNKGTLSIRRTYSRGKRGSWAVGAPKTKSSNRQVALPRLLVEGLRSQRTHQLELRRQLGADYHDQGFVFTNRQGNPLHVNALMRRFRQLTQAAGLPALRFHDLRHTSATMSLSQGTHPKIVQERLGHSSISMTMDLYSHVSMQLGREEADKLEKLIEEKKRDRDPEGEAGEH